MFLFRKRVSWILLTLLFVFDNLVSYFAIKYWGGHEGNLLIAPVVEKYPLLYFLCIPLEIAIIFVIAWLIKQAILKVSTKLRNNKKVLERIILGAIVIYWAIGNSSMNLFFLLGFRLSVSFWLFTSIVGIFLSLAYYYFALKFLLRNKER